MIHGKAVCLPPPFRTGKRGVERGVPAVPVGDGDGDAARAGTGLAKEFQCEFRAVEFREFHFLQQSESEPGGGGILPAEGEAGAAVEGVVSCRHHFSAAEPGIDFRIEKRAEIDQFPS